MINTSHASSLSRPQNAVIARVNNNPQLADALYQVAEHFDNDPLRINAFASQIQNAEILDFKLGELKISRSAVPAELRLGDNDIVFGTSINRPKPDLFYIREISNNSAQLNAITFRTKESSDLADALLLVLEASQNDAYIITQQLKSK